MNNLEIRPLKSHKTINIEAIKKFEDQIKAKLPNDYIKFLLKYNGGRPKQNVYDKMLEPITSKIMSVGVSCFYTISKDPSYNLLEGYQVLLNRVPKDLIPVAEASCGDQICLAIKGENYGKVYFWDHDQESYEDEEPTYDNIYLITNTFTDFINGLYRLDCNNERIWTKFYQSGRMETYIDVEGLTGDCARDEVLANKNAGLLESPDGYIWHHVEDGKTIILVPAELHRAVPHTGGAAILKGKK